MQYLCCICGKPIEDSDDLPGTSVDPCALILIAKWSGPEEGQEWEQYFCHLTCFKDAVKDHVDVTLGQD